ncbi:MAG: RDD family protein [Candidatus Accumulibacter regalis]|uniref:RDD family protein n=2 Tax=Candidatus Accumulibacter TaxID=327159 RepID=A0A011RGT4_ACCRE|nr:RDD family protein [Accumulibacter sp.]EXI90429.1 MAG: RDD family protein [Candidatus Accumulibacter regalis]HRE70754.1 RDD family protein [Accumulibacter sp.]HRE84839.1 RDD family protein [Accumulibacter sp.]
MTAATEAPVKRPSITRRLASMLYESLLLFGVLVALLVVPHFLLGTLTHRLATPVVVQAHTFIVLLAYCLWFWSNGRQTLAMKTWRMRLLTRDGQPVRPAQALLRYLLCWPSIILGGVGILWAVVDRERLFLHDRLAGTQLVLSGDLAKKP